MTYAAVLALLVLLSALGPEANALSLRAFGRAGRLALAACAGLILLQRFKRPEQSLGSALRLVQTMLVARLRAWRATRLIE